jgi:hypothetical protein
MTAPTYAYASLTDLKALMQLDLADTTNDARLTTLIQNASAEVNGVTGRVFATVGTADVPVTRYFDAPPTPTLRVPDVQTVIAVRIFGIALSSGEWAVLPYDLIDPAPRRYHQIRRLAAGIPYPWYTYNAVGPSNPLRAVAIDAVWGEDVPVVVAQITLEVAARLWHQEIRQYGDAAAQAAGQVVPNMGPALTDEHRRRLKPYSGKQEVLFA